VVLLGAIIAAEWPWKRDCYEVSLVGSGEREYSWCEKALDSSSEGGSFRGASLVGRPCHWQFSFKKFFSSFTGWLVIVLIPGLVVQTPLLFRSLGKLHRKTGEYWL
jgi:hypothetical protein